jgi:hypothetical protein
VQLLEVNWSARCSLRIWNVSVDMMCVAVKANVLLVREGSCRNGGGNSIALDLLSRRHPFIRCRVGSQYGVWVSLWKHVQIRTLCNLLRHTLQLLVQISPFTKKISLKLNEKHFLQKLCVLRVAALHRNRAACPAICTICRYHNNTA